MRSRLLLGLLFLCLSTACQPVRTIEPVNCNECQDGAMRCQDELTQTCARNGNGCLVWGEPTACPDEQYCDAQSNSCISSCHNGCTTEGGTQCSGARVQTCARQPSGCLDWSSAVACTGGRTCLASTNACGQAGCSDSCPTSGSTQCSGTQVQTCSLGSNGCLAWSTPVNCAGGGTCNSSAQACVYDPCMGAPAEGRCLNASTLEFCAITTGGGQPSRQTYICPSGYACTSSGGSAQCASTGVCTDGQTQCSGANTLQTCQGGQWSNSTCASGCQTNATGANCLTGSTKTVHGTVTYEARSPNANRTDWSTTLSSYYLPNAVVLSVSGDNIIDAQLTNNSGAFAIQVPNSPTNTDFVEVLAVGVDTEGNIQFAVANPNLTAGEHEAGTAPGAQSAIYSWAWYTSDVTEGATLPIPEANDSAAARLFAYLQAIHYGLWGVFSDGGRSTVLWLGQDVTWDCGACFTVTPTTVTTGSLQFASQIFIGSSAQDRAYWSDAVSAHENGHWVMASYGTSPDEGGTHVASIPTFPGQAWSEGWATYFSSFIRDDSVYVDKQNGSMFWFDIGARQYGRGQTWSRPKAADGLLQRMDENEVAAMLWKINKNGGAGADEAILNALHSPRMNTSPFKRGYTRHTWTLDSNYNLTDIADTHLSRPCVADMFDALRCAGMSAAVIDAVTQPSTNYPYPSATPLCQ